MWIRRKSSALLKFLTEIMKVLFGEASLDVGSGVIPRSGVALKENHIGQPTVDIAAAEKMVEPHFVERGKRRVRRDVAAETVVDAVGFHDHRHRVPADIASYLFLERQISRIRRLLLHRDRIQIGRVDNDLCFQFFTKQVIIECLNEAFYNIIAAIAITG